MANKALTSLILGSFWLFSGLPIQENTAPKVKIHVPNNNNSISWNRVVPYRITVSDLEDGSSAYDEIAMNEVILTIKYVPDATKANDFLATEAKKNWDTLSWMGRNACFTCHRAKDKLIGPSFSEIAKRYSEQPDSVLFLVQKIMNGGKGNWGEQIMPAQPHLLPEQVEGVIKWILRNGKAEDLNYFSGLEGAFRTRAKPADGEKNGLYVLQAHYLDHGLKGNSPDGKLGSDSLFLRLD
ncbi:MAG: hypothetical protein E4H26_04760 [Flavobacteriales bacterium]|nr:MAG: hypothetical protein E4H26_04760 [Flavobacteriales bacterium]